MRRTPLYWPATSRRQRGFIAAPFLGIGRRGGDPFFDDVVLLLGNDNQANGSTTFIDYSSAARTLTAVGNTAYTTTGPPTGLTSSIAFDGANDELYADDAADLELGSGDFTIEGYCFSATGRSSNDVVIGKRSTQSDFGAFLIILIGADLKWHASSNNTSWDIGNAKAMGTPTIDTWFHWALVRSGSTFTPYLDGVAQSGTVTSTASLVDTTKPVHLGMDHDGNTDFLGRQAAVRITKAARYTANFTPPTLPLPTF